MTHSVRVVRVRNMTSFRDRCVMYMLLLTAITTSYTYGNINKSPPECAAYLLCFEAPSIKPTDWGFYEKSGFFKMAMFYLIFEYLEYQNT